MTCRLNVLYKYVCSLVEIPLMVIKRTQNSIKNDQREITNKTKLCSGPASRVHIGV